MIIQGTNNPIQFAFPDSMTTIADIEISLYTEDRELKHWSKSDVSIDGKKIYAPITQEDSIGFPKGKCYIDIKWMDAMGRVRFAKTLTNNIIARNDKTIMTGAATD